MSEMKQKKMQKLNSAETVERRVLAKRKAVQAPVTATQSAGQAASGFYRLHAAAKRAPDLQFNNVLHHITCALLRDAYFALNRRSAKGIDEQSWQTYGEENLERKLQDLHARVHTGRYHPKPSKRIWIPKADGTSRPIGIAAIEDKIVQQALVWVIQEIYEADFQGFSYGFRPGKSQHNALDALYMAITTKKVSWVLDADIQGFFDNLDHEWLMHFISHRISDKRVLELVIRTLRAGTEEDGQRSKSAVGTPQGAVISPLLANIYLHHVLDLWVTHWRKHHTRGELYIVRYADDFVIGFQYKDDGERFQGDLEQRLAEYNLTLHPDKTRLIEFGRFAQSNRQARGQSKPDTFNFLGFTHICGQRRDDKGFKLLRQTIAKKQRQTVHRIKHTLMKINRAEIHLQGKWLRQVVQGYMNYFGVPSNRGSLEGFRAEICRGWYKALRRRGNKKPMSWKRLQKYIRLWIPSVRIVHPYPNQRWRV